jgi:hypothetical protein
MVTQEIVKYWLEVFWDDEFKGLNYINEPFNDDPNVQHWLDLGYPNKFTGDMCDMRMPQPSWNHKFISIFEDLGWKDIGTSYYRMMPGTVLPTHSDLYLKYVDLFNLKGKEHNIRRAIVFLEDWKPGHYFEAMDEPLVNWQAGTVIEWTYDTPHMAANMGSSPRHTLQITGHLGR